MAQGLLKSAKEFLVCHAARFEVEHALHRKALINYQNKVDLLLDRTAVKGTLKIYFPDGRLLHIYLKTILSCENLIS